jgi:NADPH dehydrogenase (quinone)
VKNVLLINAHKRYEGFSSGALNQAFVDTAQAKLNEHGYNTKTTIINDGWDVAAELTRFAWADAIIVQTPVNWMSVPYLFKQYIDEVISAGQGGVIWKNDGRTRSDPSKKYGSGGLMGGKSYMISTTWNAPQESLEDPDQFFEGKGVDGVFFWLHKMFQFCDMKPLPTFSCFDVFKNPDIESDLERFKDHLETAFTK